MPYLGTFNVHDEIGWEDDHYDYALQVNLSRHILRVEMKDAVVSLYMYDNTVSFGGDWNTVADIVDNWPRVNQVEKE